MKELQSLVYILRAVWNNTKSKTTIFTKLLRSNIGNSHIGSNFMRSCVVLESSEPSFYWTIELLPVLLERYSAHYLLGSLLQMFRIKDKIFVFTLVPISLLMYRVWSSMLTFSCIEACLDLFRQASCIVRGLTIWDLFDLHPKLWMFASTGLLRVDVRVKRSLESRCLDGCSLVPWCTDD